MTCPSESVDMVSGIQATNRQVLQSPTSKCLSLKCQKLISHGDQCIAGLSAFGAPSLLCSMKCVQDFEPDFFEKIIFDVEPEICGYKDCDNTLTYGASYYRVFGTSKLCCSSECADNEFNIEWRGQDDWRADIARIDWDQDQRDIKDDKLKYRC